MEAARQNIAAGMSQFEFPGWEQIPDFGLYMDQVMTFMQRQFLVLFGEGERVLTPAMVNNYVKMGLVFRPVGKKYGREQLAQLLMICLLKQSVTAEEMKQLLCMLENRGVRDLYEGFSQIQQDVFSQASVQAYAMEPISCALYASAFRLLLNGMTGETSFPLSVPGEKPRTEK